MILSKVVLENWMCFRGRHELELGPKAYAIVARHERDPERSNFLGKSSLPEAVQFALYGVHRHRLEDGWIARGEDEGAVILLFDDGFEVVRSRRRGKSTELFATEVDDCTSVESRKDAAQKVIERRLGLSHRDFRASCYFEQREAARLVLADPADRMKIVEAWLELGPLKAAEAHNAAKLSAEAQYVSARSLERSALGKLDDAAALERELRRHELLLAEARDALAAAWAEDAKLREAGKGRLNREEYVRLVEEGRALAAEVRAENLPGREGVLNVLQDTFDELRGVARAAAADEGRKVRLARGEFDGVCPVAGIACPAREQINSRTVENAALHVQAVMVYDAAAADAKSAQVNLDKQRAHVNEARAKVTRLEQMRKRAIVLEEQGVDASPAPPVDVRGAAERVELANAEVLRVSTIVERLAYELVRANEVARKDAKLKADLEAAEKRLATLREAALILGRNGAQRRVAQPFLEAIEHGANDALDECGVGLRVAVRWEHEGQDLARACGLCGEPFASGRKEKACSRCGGARGPAIVNRLDFEFSDRSAAAEDLWGIAMQLSACAWLRRQRGVQLSVAMLDEPCAAMDRSHRRAMTKAFATMLSGRFGFRQSFVISHSQGEQDAFPGRIEVVRGDDGWSSVRVVA